MIKIDEVAKLYNAPVHLIRRMIKDGRIPAKKIGRDWQFELADLPGHIPASDNRSIGLTLRTSGESAPATPDPMAKAKLEKEQALAALKIMEVKKELGELVSAKEIEAAAFKIARRVRDAILGIPQKVAAEVACETDPHTVELILSRELKEALRGLNDGNEIGNG